MRKALLAAAAAAVLTGPAPAQITTQGQAFEAGKAFSNSAAGAGAATGTVNTSSGTTNVPNYNTNPAESSVYGGGKNPIGAAGTNKVLNCANFSAANAYDQQECNAVNYLQKLPSQRVPFVIDPKLDPLMVNSKATIANPGTLSATSASACHIEKTTLAGTYTTETCEESTILTTFACNKTLLPQCGYVGAPISSHTESRSGAFAAATLSDAGQTGLYNYSMQAFGCGTEGSAEIVFNLDTIGFGSFVTIDMSNLDDAAAIGVNGTTVFAGYPNNGPQYSGGFFPSTAKAFQVGYSWQEDMGGLQCVAFDVDNNCTAQTFFSNLQPMSANTKLLDYCPAGYAPLSQLAFQACDPSSGTCTMPSSYTPFNVPGFFCNAEGKFLMNRHEGGGTWAGSVSSQMPLQTGANRITAYWGTSTSGGACGNVSVTGQIYNVAPGCTNRWDDQCAGPRGALKQ